MNILGISAFYHDSAACLVQDGNITAAVQEERFSRLKHDAGFPDRAIEYCLKTGSLETADLDYIAFYEKPFQKFDRLLHTYLAYAPRGLASFIRAMPLWLKQKLWIKDYIARELDFPGQILFLEHHQSHAAAAFFPSPYDEAAFLTVDGVGEWPTASYGSGSGNQLQIAAEMHFPHSLGLLYSAFTYFCGFRVNSGEYKLMGLAPYGTPRYVKTIKDNLIDLKNDGSFRLNMDYFTFTAGLTMTGQRFARLFGGPPRQPEAEITQREMDLARSVQAVTEEILLLMAEHVIQETQQKNLVLAGGVALNCVANGRLLREGPFDNIWIQPAAGDAGGALGAALFTWYQYLGNTRTTDSPSDCQQASLLGPEYSEAEIERYLQDNNIPYQPIGEMKLTKQTAKLIEAGKVVGWFQGRMEFGPRALGNRSILGDARSPRMQSVMNLKIKFRESFRPFAPAVLAELADQYFELDRESPYMLIVAPVQAQHKQQETATRSGLDQVNDQRSTIPAVTHVDYSARIQTVSDKDNPKFYALIKEFYARTNCPVLVNTSFNVRGEPIVRTPCEAYTCFMRTDMDYLVIENFLLDKVQQPEFDDTRDWQTLFKPD